MHLIALSWDVERPGELDPRVVGLARGLADRGVSCEVVTLGTGPTSTRPVDGVDVTWVAEAPPVLPPVPDYDLARVLASATRASAGAEARCQDRVPDAVLAVGWQTAWTATTLRSTRGTPVVAWLDSTASGRAGGRLDDTGRLVAQVEWWLTYEARRVVAPDAAVASRVRREYRLPPGKVAVVPAAVPLPEAPTATADEVVVRGPRPVVEAVRRRVGSVPVTTERDALLWARVAVVADGDAVACLAAMAAGAAVVVDDDGPLRRLVHARRSGVRTDGTPAGVADAVAGLLAAPDRRDRLGAAARARVAARHAPGDVAAATLGLVHEAAQEEATLATAAPARPLRPLMLASPLLDPGGPRPTPPNGRRVRRTQG